MHVPDHGSRNADGKPASARTAVCSRRACLPDRALLEIVRHAEDGYPDEVCGIVIGRPGAPDTYQVRPVPNLANREQQEDAEGRLRDARTAYKMDPLAQLRVLREADAAGWDVIVFYHSHPDHGAYFSSMDRARALAAPGEPLWPGAVYVVVSVIGGVARAASRHAWDGRRQDFDQRPIRIPGASARRGGDEVASRGIR